MVKLLDSIAFKKPVTLKQLRNLGIIGATEGPRPFTFITQEQFESICQLGKGDKYEK